MTLAQKRKIVRRFKGGASIRDIYESMPEPVDAKAVEDVIRDFVNGKSALTPKRRRAAR